METKNLKIGDKIAINTSANYSSACFLKFSEVEKVTPSGQVLATNKMKFNKYGEQIKTKLDQFPSGCIVDLGWAEKAVESDKIRRASNKSVMDLEVALGGRKTGRGDYHLSEKQLALINELCETLK